MRGPVPNAFPTREPATVRVALVGEAPGDSEVRMGIPFCGASGFLLNSALSSVGLSREECFVGNVCQFRPSATSNDFSLLPWEGEEVQGGIAALLHDLAAWRPNVVVALGNVPLHLLRHGNVAPPKSPKKGYAWPSKITAWRGSLFMAHESFSLEPAGTLNVDPAANHNPNGVGNQRALIQATRFKCMATWHPAFVLRAYGKLFDLRQDLRRARDEGESAALTLPALDIRWGPALAP